MTNTEKDTAMQELQSAVEAANMAGHKVRWAAIAAREAGATWQQIGEAEGITKQRAQQKYADSVTPEAIANRARLATLTTDALLAESKRLRESNDQARAEREARWAAEDAALAAPAAELTDDDGQEPATASIFLEAPAPAKPKKAPSKRWEAKTYHRLTAYGVTLEGPAEPGTGKGPQFCPSCENNNHKTTTRDICQFGKSCTPTRYDTAEITACMIDTFTAMNEAKKAATK